MINKITSLNKDWAVEEYFKEFSKKLSYTQILEEFKIYFAKDKKSYSVENLEKEIRQNCPQLFEDIKKEKEYASSISSSSKF